MRLFALALTGAAIVGLAACDSEPTFVPVERCDPGTLSVETLDAGDSPSTVRATSTVVVDYLGTLVATRDTFDANPSARFNLGQTVAGFRQGLTGTVIGDSVRIVIPPELGYGGRDQRDGAGNVTIPACSTIQFNVRVLDIVG